MMMALAKVVVTNADRIEYWRGGDLTSHFPTWLQ